MPRLRTLRGRPRTREKNKKDVGSTSVLNNLLKKTRDDDTVRSTVSPKAVGSNSVPSDLPKKTGSYDAVRRTALRQAAL